VALLYSRSSVVLVFWISSNGIPSNQSLKNKSTVLLISHSFIFRQTPLWICRLFTTFQTFLSMLSTFLPSTFTRNDNEEPQPTLRQMINWLVSFFSLSFLSLILAHFLSSDKYVFLRLLSMIHNLLNIIIPRSLGLNTQGKCLFIFFLPRLILASSFIFLINKTVFCWIFVCPLFRGKSVKIEKRKLHVELGGVGERE